MNDRNMKGRRLQLSMAPLALVLLGSTCVVIEEEPGDITYGEESNAEAMQEEMTEDVIRDSER